MPRTLSRRAGTSYQFLLEHPFYDIIAVSGCPLTIRPDTRPRPFNLDSKVVEKNVAALAMLAAFPLLERPYLW